MWVNTKALLLLYVTFKLLKIISLFGKIYLEINLEDNKPAITRMKTYIDVFIIIIDIGINIKLK